PKRVPRKTQPATTSKRRMQAKRAQRMPQTAIICRTPGSRHSGRAAALGCRAHTGWAALVVVAGGLARPEVVARGRAEVGGPSGRVGRRVSHAARALEPAAAAALVEAAERVAAEHAAAAIERTVGEARDEDAVLRSCAVVVGTFAGGTRLESILASH